MMNTTGITTASHRSTHFLYPEPLRQQTGFSLVEVLVTALLLSIGVLGMASLQGRAISYNTDSQNRATAAMLASDLLDLMRASPTRWSDYLDNTSNPSVPNAPCRATPDTANAQLACWLADIDALLPPAATDHGQGSRVCRSQVPGQCTAKAAVIEVQVAWQGRPGECFDTSASSLCHYLLRGEL